MAFDFLKPKQPTDKLGQPISQAPNALSKVIEPPKTALTPYINAPSKPIVSLPPVSKYIPNRGSSSPSPPKINEPTPTLSTQPTDKLGQPISQAPQTLNQIVAPKPTALTPSLPIVQSKPSPQPEPNSIVPYSPVTKYDSYSKEINRPVTEAEAKSLGLNYLPTTSTNPNAPVRIILPNQNLIRQDNVVTPKQLTSGQARDYVKNVLNKRIESRYKSESNKVINQLLPSYQEQANRIVNSNLSEEEKTKQINSLSNEYSNKVNEITKTSLSSDKEFINSQDELVRFSNKFNVGTDIYGKNYYKDLEQTQIDKNKQTLKDISQQAITLTPLIGATTIIATAPTELKYQGDLNKDIQNKQVDLNKVIERYTPEGKLQVALGTGALLLEGGIGIKAAEKAVQEVRLADLINKKPVLEVGISDKLSTGELDTQAILKATQKTPYGKIETFTNIKSLNLGEDLITVAGKGKQKIEIYDVKKLGSVSDKEALIRTTKDFKFASEMPLDIIKGENILKPIGKGTKQQLSNEVSGVSGNVLVDITGEKQLRKINVGGFSKQENDLIYAVSGEGRKVRVPKIQTTTDNIKSLSKTIEGINSKPYSFEVAPEAKVLVEPQKLSVIKILNEEDKKPLFDIVNKELNLKGNIPEKTIISYHGTTDKQAEEILSKGLKAGKELDLGQNINGKILNEVYTTPDKEWAKGWAGRASFGKGGSGKPTLLKIELPKSVDKELAIRRQLEKGGGPEFTYKNIPKEYITKIDINELQSQKLIQEVKPTSIKESMIVSNQVMKELEKSSLEKLNKPNLKLPLIKPQIGFKSIAELQNKPKSQSLSLTGIKSRQTISNKLNQELATATKSRSRTVSLSTSSSGVSEFQQPSIKEALKSEQVTKQQLKQLTRQVNIPTSPIRPNIKNPIPELDLAPPSGYGNQEGYGSKELKKLMQKTKRRKPSYTASLGAALFEAKPVKVTQKEYDRLSKTVFSGAETRPVLEIIKPKKRKV